MIDINDVVIRDGKAYYNEEELPESRYTEINSKVSPKHVIFSTTDNPQTRLGLLFQAYIYSKLSGAKLIVHKYVPEWGWDGVNNKIYDFLNVWGVDAELVTATELRFDESKTYKNGNELHMKLSDNSSIRLMKSNLTPTYEMEVAALCYNFPDFVTFSCNTGHLGLLAEDFGGKLFYSNDCYLDKSVTFDFNIGVKQALLKLHVNLDQNIPDYEGECPMYFENPLLNVAHIKAIKQMDPNVLYKHYHSASDNDKRIILNKLGFV